MNMSKILSCFGIKTEQKNDFLWICLPFTAAITLILFTTLLLGLTPLNKVFNPQNVFVTILAVISTSLVLSNTLIFAYKNPQATVKNPRNIVPEKPNKSLSWCNILNHITFAAAAILLLYLLSQFNCSITVISSLSILIFILFVIADRLFIKHLDDCIAREMDENSKKNFNIKRSVMEKALVLIDLAGSFGICFILLISKIFSWCDIANDNFIQGFGIGALAFHIIFTQFNWAYLKIDELKKLALI